MLPKNKKLDLPWASGDPGDVTLVISAGEVKLVTNLRLRLNFELGKTQS